jgi:hypothetical protein
MARYARDEVEPHVSALVSSMIRSIRQETTESEAVKALKGKKSIIMQLDIANSF